MTPHPLRNKFSWFTAIAFGVGLLLCVSVKAHPLLEDALDVVIYADHITLEARVTPEQILIAEAAGAKRASAAEWPGLIQKHRAYLPQHLHVKADGLTLTAISVDVLDATAATGKEPGSSALIGFKLEYAVSRPVTLQIDQSLLRGLSSWSVSCVLRIRQSTDDTFQSMLLTADKSAEFTCQWTPPATSAAASPSTATGEAGARPAAEPQMIHTAVNVPATIGAYLRHGVMHILTGYDHLLFVSALVLAARGVWDLVKVVSAFTLAHTLTLILSVCKVVTVSQSTSHNVVEPMIAASIVFVAVQNIFWPRQSRGWTRLAIAFGFGLFHGLGFAGGLQQAMSEMPPAGLWAALLAFSLGVELGHQVVVLPLFALLQMAKHLGTEVPRVVLANRARTFGSTAIAAGGIYFLVSAFAT